IHVGDAVVELLHREERAVGAPGVDGAREAIAHVVVDLYRLLEGIDPDHAQHRAEDLFLLQPAAGLDAREDRGAVIEALAQPRATGLLPAAHQLRPFLLADSDILLDLAPCRLMD